LAPERWADYSWPAWVPAGVRDQVEEFYSESMGRGPRSWMQSAIGEGAPNFGAVVTLERIVGHEKRTGRFVFAWNNIGRVVHDDGSFSYVWGWERGEASR
jgi:hypothetical protein